MEVLIAVSVVALMGGLIYGSFGPLLKAKEVIEAQSEHYRSIEGALTRMSREISMAFMSEDFDHTRFRDKTDMPTFFVGERDQLAFTSFAHQRRYRDAKESDQAVFEYRMGRDPDADIDGNSNDVLLRRENPLIDNETSSCLSGVDNGQSDECGLEQVLADDVTQISFEYYDDQKHEWEEEWSTRQDRDRLPERVRITLTTTDETGNEVKYSTEARIYMRLPLKHS